MKICNLEFSAKFLVCRDENVNQMVYAAGHETGGMSDRPRPRLHLNTVPPTSDLLY